MVERYLSTEHRDNPAHGCPVAALCAEVVHEGATTRAAFTESLRGLLASVGQVVPGETKSARDARLRTTASLVGGLVLARATSDEGLSDGLLAAVRRGLCDRT
jgi:TetR/AcrR family transcriptional repressor of nem operon